MVYLWRCLCGPQGGEGGGGVGNLRASGRPELGFLGASILNAVGLESQLEPPKKEQVWVLWPPLRAWGGIARQSGLDRTMHSTRPYAFIHGKP